MSAGPVVGFVGLGRMGAPMAANVARAGFPLVVHDRRPEAAEPLVAEGARWAADAAGCAAAADVLVTMLPTPADVREVLLGTAGAGGAAGALRPGSTWIDMSTSTPEVAAEVRRVVEPRGVAVLDAPVAGMVAGARAGTLGIYVGGDAETLAACRPVLEAMGDVERILHIGPHGAGYVTKLCINLLWFMHEVATAEVLSIGVRAGARLEALQRAIVASPATSQVVAHDLDCVWRDGDYDESFPLALVCKDLGLAADLARAVGVPAEMTALTEQVFRRAMATYGGGAGEMSAVRLYEDLIRTPLRYSA